MLLRAKADPNVVTTNGATPFQVACEDDRLDMAKELLDHGAEIDMVGGGAPCQQSAAQPSVAVLRP